MKYFITFIAGMILFLSSCSFQKDTIMDPVKELDLAAKQIEKSIAQFRDTTLLPRYIENGEVHFVESRDWTSGFFAGNLWYLYEHIGDEAWKAAAHHFSMNVEKEQFSAHDHDVGFRMYCSFGNGYRLTKNPEYRDVLIQSAKTLISRYNPVVGAIRSWDFNTDIWQYPVIIDNMMNLELLFWASKETGDPIYYDIAVAHALKTMESHFRSDNSSYHVISFDTISGEIEKKHTRQGYGHESAWARGQSWGLYGFTLTYRETKDERFLEQSKKIAGFILDHPNRPKDGVPYWDYDDPDRPDIPRDASAGAIAASALYELSGYCDDEAEKKKYLDGADHILASLASDFKILGDHTYPLILDHSVGSIPQNSEVDIPIVYADYYFLEALIRRKALSQP